jgi:hypothetical protein
MDTKIICNSPNLPMLHVKESADPDNGFSRKHESPSGIRWLNVKACPATNATDEKCMAAGRDR